MERNDDIIDKIIHIEWDMFQAVNEGGPRADCQEDRATFEAMRRAQFLAWSPEACDAYFDDLMNAELDGRNLIAEKYIHMMKTTSPAQYGALAKTIPMPDDFQQRLAADTTRRLLAQTVSLHLKYPYVSGSGRPLHTKDDVSGVASIETYQLSELLTYSVKTLQLLSDHVTALEEAGRSLAGEILANTVKYYGYETLESAEAATKAIIIRKGTTLSGG